MPQTGWLKTTEIWRLSLGVQNQVAGRDMTPWMTVGGKSFLASFSFWWLLAIPIVPSFVLVPLQSLLWLQRTLYPAILCISVSPKLPLLIKKWVIGFRAQFNPVWPYLKFINLQRPYFQIRSHSQVPGIKASTCLFGTQFNSWQIYTCLWWFKETDIS